MFIIANISTIGFGAYDRYRSKEHPAGTDLNDYVEKKLKKRLLDLEITMIIGIEY